MKLKASSKGKWRLKPKLGLGFGLAALFLSWSIFFLTGLFASNLISQDIADGRQRARPRKLQSVKQETMDYDLLSPGESGDDSITLIPFQVLSWKPRALYFPKFATAEQCQTIINIAKASLRPSIIVGVSKGEKKVKPEGIRTSSGMFISASEDKTGVLDAIEEKVARATMLPRNHGEAFNVLRYEIGQKYVPHYDAFNPAEYAALKGQRVASFLLYLSDVEEGGETMFPFENGLDVDKSYDFQKCTGLQVKPRQGDGLLFYSLFPNNTIDPTSVHGSCPVIKGEKWVATKWIRDQ